LPLETPNSDAELSPLAYLAEVGSFAPEVAARFAQTFPTLATLDTAKQVPGEFAWSDDLLGAV
jgi:hypothetical protein